MIKKANETENDKNDNSTKQKRIKYEDISEEPVKKKAKTELYKPPTVEELNELKETENLYNNNLFRLQIKELLAETTIKNKRKKELANWMESFKTCLENISEFDDINMSQLKNMSKKKLNKQQMFINSVCSKHKIDIIKTDQDLTLKMVKPESFEVFGLYENQSLPGPNLIVKINIKMPKKCFHVKDFLNNRYFVKRYLYLLYIAECLNESKIAHNMRILFEQNHSLLPILEIQPEPEKLKIQIYVTPCDNYFKSSRFLPDVNNLKQDLFETDFHKIEILKETPTIFYNSVLAHDVTLSENNAYIKSVLKEQENVQDGIKLLCVWLKQRELHVGFGAFNENLILYIIVYLLSKKKINKFMSSYQVVRNFWSFLSTTPLEENAISIADVSQEVLNNFKKSFDIVVLDKSGCYNVASFLNVEIYRKVKLECVKALELLDNNDVNSFQILFLTKLPFYLQYDTILDLTMSLPLENQKGLSDTEKATFIGYQNLLNINYISNILKRGLKSRILNIVPRIIVNDSEGVCTIKELSFGINLNPETAFNFIELGPSLNEHFEAEEFRKFWTHLSSDRRFRDGSTRVALYFKTNTIKAKRDILKKMFKYLLSEKLKLNYKLFYDELDDMILNKKIITPYPCGTNEESSLKIITISDELGKKIRELKMSLHITGIQGISNVYSYTDVFPPIATNYKLGQTLTQIKDECIVFSTAKKIKMIPRYVEPIECVLQLAYSSKWPNDLQGVRYLIAAFYLEMSKKLKDSHNIVSHVTKTHLDIFYQGLIFRYRMHVPKEIAMLKKNVSEDGTIYYTDSEESRKLEWKMNVLPTLQGALRGLQLQHPSFGPSCALIKRWLSSQLIDDFLFPDVVLYLLNASLFLNKNTFVESSLPQIAFMRFLKFISELQWKLQPVVVNLNDELTKEQICESDLKFQQNRDSFPPLFIILPHDENTTLLTKNSPSAELLTRVQQLASVTLNFICNSLENHSNFEVKDIFLPNLEGYNLLIHLRPLLNPRRHEQVLDSNPNDKIILEKYDPKENNKIPIVGFNPVELYLTTLRENYGEFAEFFHDTFGGNVIGVLWKPRVFEGRDFKVLQVDGHKLEENNKLTFNMEAIIEDFYITGKDLVKMIEKR